MSVKNTYLLSISILTIASSCSGAVTKLSTETEAPFNTAAAAYGAGAVASAIVWGFLQNKYSHLAHKRYPLMQQKNILMALKEKSPEVMEKLADVERKLSTIESERNIYHWLRTIATISSIASGSKGVWEWKKAKKK